MIVLEIIAEIIGRIFVEIIFEGIILGSFKILKKGYRFIKRTLAGRTKEESIEAKQKLKENLLYKNIVLTENLNRSLKAGQKGAVLEIIDETQVFVEFYDARGNQIAVENDLVFKVKMQQFKLKRG